MAEQLESQTPNTQSNRYNIKNTMEIKKARELSIEYSTTKSQFLDGPPKNTYK